MRTGHPSRLREADGIYLLATGDGGPLPKGYIHLVQYGPNDEILLELRHEKFITDGGYVDFFGGPNNRPADGDHVLRLTVPAKSIAIEFFRCSFRDESQRHALTNRLEQFLRDREYRQYTGFPAQ